MSIQYGGCCAFRFRPVFETTATPFCLLFGAYIQLLKTLPGENVDTLQSMEKINKQFLEYSIMDSVAEGLSQIGIAEDEGATKTPSTSQNNMQLMVYLWKSQFVLGMSYYTEQQDFLLFYPIFTLGSLRNMLAKQENIAPHSLKLFLDYHCRQVSPFLTQRQKNGWLMIPSELTTELDIPPYDNIPTYVQEISQQTNATPFKIAPNAP